MLSLSGATGAPAAPRGADLSLTPDEEREARVLLEEFNRKFVETNDIDPLVKDYFVTDFSSRLRQNAETFPFTFIDWKDEAAPPDPEDLRRLYVETTNSLHGLFPLYAAAAKRCAEEEEKDDAGEGGAKGDGLCDDEYDPRMEKFLPPAAVGIMKTDPLLREMWFGSRESDAASDEVDSQAEGATSVECAGGCASPRGHEDRLIQNAAELRHLTELLGDLNKALREHLAAYPVSFEEEAAADGDEESKAAELQKFDPKSIDIFRSARVFDKEFYGYPEGTRVVCANVGALHAELVRVDGRLRILTVYMLMEG
ncbi:MAG: hypothetical protein LC774_00965 [Acidobacteria bacterium]|nr:hypothetical protein [Acidobacteriota bacterium]